MNFRASGHSEESTIINRAFEVQSKILINIIFKLNLHIENISKEAQDKEQHIKQMEKEMRLTEEDKERLNVIPLC